MSVVPLAMFIMKFNETPYILMINIHCAVTFAKFIQNCDWWPSDIVVTSPFSKAIMKLTIKKMTNRRKKTRKKAIMKLTIEKS